MAEEEDPAPVDAWLGPEFLEDVLRDALNEPKLEVVRGKVRPDEDHFGDDATMEEAQVRRVWAQWVDSASQQREGEVSLVVKAEAGGEDGRALRRLRLFAKERRVYASALPDMTRLLTRAQPALADSLPPLAPRFFPCHRHDALVIQDLTAEGFRAADPRRGLDLAQCLSVVDALAHFHARSVALRHQRPDALLDFRESFFTAENAASLRETLEPALGALALAVDGWSGFERFGDKIRRLQATAVERMVEAMKPDGARPLVLNHGDLWTGSLLFKHEFGGGVREVRFINFQLARWGSPALDLQFFLHSSPSEEVRAKSSDRLLATYHTTLASALAGLKCFAEVPSLEQLKTEMAEKALVGALAAFCVLGRVATDPQSPEDTRAHEDRYRSALQRLLPIFEAQGVL